MDLLDCSTPTAQPRGDVVCVRRVPSCKGCHHELHARVPRATGKESSDDGSARRVGVGGSLVTLVTRRSPTTLTQRVAATTMRRLTYGPRLDGASAKQSDDDDDEGGAKTHGARATHSATSTGTGASVDARRRRRFRPPPPLRASCGCAAPPCSYCSQSWIGRYSLWLRDGILMCHSITNLAVVARRERGAVVRAAGREHLKRGTAVTP